MSFTGTMVLMAAGSAALGFSGNICLWYLINKGIVPNKKELWAFPALLWIMAFVCGVLAAATWMVGHPLS